MHQDPLCQPRAVVIEKEMLAILFGTQKFEQYIYGCPTKVETDHKPLESVLQKSILSAPKRLQRMTLPLQKYDLNVTYNKGAHRYRADTLSRAYLPKIYNTETCDKDVVMIMDQRGDAEQEAEHINTLQFLPVTEETSTRIKEATEADEDMHALKKIIRQGWPEMKDKIPESLAPYFSFCDHDS
ncbi:uncharacterized protein [Montipora capricornis]|uniref:uncharacterized protein n=1 Tax=Montipora capricornis TaxID=246305 RepID=UPI0035F17C8C